MARYRVFRSISFQSELAKYNKSVQDRVDKVEDRLVENPKYGRPLGTSWLRESRFENYRIYYLIYEDLESVFMVAISDKKNQQRTINTIKVFLDFFREEIEKIILEENSQDEAS
jgi:mRNA-degrading endonuclease RelE of RelBE toxin-antitoxin system